MAYYTWKFFSWYSLLPASLKDTDRSLDLANESASASSKMSLNISGEVSWNTFMNPSLMSPHSSKTEVSTSTDNSWVREKVSRFNNKQSHWLLFCTCSGWYKHHCMYFLSKRVDSSPITSLRSCSSWSRLSDFSFDGAIIFESERSILREDAAHVCGKNKY